jgi:uncharacterized protein with HEPN domain
MSRDDAAHLLDMLLAARDAVSFATGLNWAQFEKSRLHQNVVLKAIEIIGEAAAHIGDETKLDHPLSMALSMISFEQRGPDLSLLPQFNDRTRKASEQETA